MSPAAFAERIAGYDRDATYAARWTVAWALRHLGRSAEALAAQRALKSDQVAAGVEDHDVEEEITTLEGGISAER